MLQHKQKFDLNFIKALIIILFAGCSVIHAEPNNKTTSFEKQISYLNTTKADLSTPPDLMKDFEVLRQQLEQNPSDVGVLNSMGIIYARAGRIEDAILLWQRGLSINPRYIHLYNNLGSALKTQKRYDEALKVFQIGLQIQQSYWLYYNLGLLYKELGKRNEAIAAFKSALSLNPGFEAAFNKLKELGIQPPPANTWAQIPTVPPHLPSVSIKAPVMNGNLELDDLVSANLPNDMPRQGKYYETQQTKPPPAEKIEPAAPYTIETCASDINKISAQGQRLVALTFDDGPHAAYTRQLLDYLHSEGVKATFFVLGSRAEVYPDLITRMAQEGHEIGNHTWSHKSLAKAGSAAARNEIQRTSETIAVLTGTQPRLVRPPYGHTNAEVHALIQSQGMREVLWDADSRDWAGGSTDRMLARVVHSFSPGCIVLFHDIHPGALHVLPVLIPALKKCNYRFVTVSQLSGTLQQTASVSVPLQLAVDPPRL